MTKCPPERYYWGASTPNSRAQPVRLPDASNLHAHLLKYWLELPSRLRLPTSAPFQPMAVRDPAEAVEEFQAIGKALEEKLNSARELALDRVKLVSPFAEKMKYNAYSAFVLIAAHNRRHLWQAELALRS